MFIEINSQIYMKNMWNMKKTFGFDGQIYVCDYRIYFYESFHRVKYLKYTNITKIYCRKFHVFFLDKSSLRKFTN